MLVALAAFGCRDRSALPLPPLTPAEHALAQRLEAHVRVLAVDIGGRDLDHPEALEAAGAYIESTWQEQGYVVASDAYTVGETTVRNLEVELRGTDLPEEIIVVGAHYDTAYGNPGADDNGSGVAAMLELSGAFARTPGRRTLRFVAFVNEEPPYFHTDAMGSLVNARRAKQRGDDIVGMFSLETLAYYDDRPGTQHYPKIVAALYPDRGNFIAVVGNARSRRFVNAVVQSFHNHSTFPVESIAASDAIQGIGWSDHWSFYKQGYPAVMITDTAPNRNPHYHTEQDTPEKLDFESTARVVAGLTGVVGDAINPTHPRPAGADG